MSIRVLQSSHFHYLEKLKLKLTYYFLWFYCNDSQCIVYNKYGLFCFRFWFCVCVFFLNQSLVRLTCFTRIFKCSLLFWSHNYSFNSACLRKPAVKPRMQHMKSHSLIQRLSKPWKSFLRSLSEEIRAFCNLILPIIYNLHPEDCYMCRRGKASKLDMKGLLPLLNQEHPDFVKPQAGIL